MLSHDQLDIFIIYLLGVLHVEMLSKGLFFGVSLRVSLGGLRSKCLTQCLINAPVLAGQIVFNW